MASKRPVKLMLGKKKWERHTGVPIKQNMVATLATLPFYSFITTKGTQGPLPCQRKLSPCSITERPKVAKHVRTGSKKKTARTIRQTLGLTIWLLRLLRIAKDIHAALQNTGNGAGESSHESQDDVADGGAEVDFGMDWGSFDVGIF